MSIETIILLVLGLIVCAVAQYIYLYHQRRVLDMRHRHKMEWEEQQERLREAAYIRARAVKEDKEMEDMYNKVLKDMKDDNEIIKEETDEQTVG